MLTALGGIAMWLGLVLLVIGGIWFIIAAFKEGLLWGLGVLFVPFVSLVFLILGWPEAKRPFFLQLAGVGLILLAALALSAPFPLR